MTDPNNTDDNWGELYRELGVDDPGSSKPIPPDDDEVIELTESVSDEISEPVQSFDEGGADEIEEPAEGEVVAGEEEGEPGQKKRRRRRRRRKKKGGAGQAVGEDAAGSDIDAEESETQLEEDEDEDGAEAITGPGVEEEVTPEMTRDIIANWNVPSWEEIVTGLHRPER